MLEYTSFLNTIGIYLDLLELDKIIQTYQKMMTNNINEKEIYENLKNTINFYQQEKNVILGNNKMEDVKEEILSMKDFILNYLLDNKEQLDTLTLYHSKIGKRRLPLYAIFQEIVKCDISFFNIYVSLIQNNLYNPNFAYGVSDEPFYTLLPIEPIDLFYQINQIVIGNPKTDFHILRNGSDVIAHALNCLSNSENERIENYWKDYIMNAVKGSCSLLDSRRYHGVLNYEMNPSIFNIMQHPKLERVQAYLLSEQGANKQLENAIYPSLERDKAIDFYIERIMDSNIRKKLYQKKYQKQFLP